jgi:23S rRNA pseudouridine1911/1915/1917 synthase
MGTNPCIHASSLYFCSMLEVLYEDNHLIAVNKSAGIGVQGDSSGDRHLLDIAGDYLKVKYKKPGAAFVGLIHRLDRPVSGVVLLAKTSKGLSRMNEQFRNKSTHKIYHAITEQELAENTGTLTHWLGKDSKTHRALTYGFEKPGTKLAILHFTCLTRSKGHALYEIELETGRFHQIRAQLAKSKAPIIGDVKYGADAPLPDRSIALHARKLSFKHPITGVDIDITAPYPKTSVWQSVQP